MNLSNSRAPILLILLLSFSERFHTVLRKRPAQVSAHRLHRGPTHPDCTEDVPWAQAEEASAFQLWSRHSLWVIKKQNKTKLIISELYIRMCGHAEMWWETGEITSFGIPLLCFKTRSLYHQLVYFLPSYLSVLPTEFCLLACSFTSPTDRREIQPAERLLLIPGIMQTGILSVPKGGENNRSMTHLSFPFSAFPFWVTSLLFLPGLTPIKKYP